MVRRFDSESMRRAADWISCYAGEMGEPDSVRDAVWAVGDWLAEEADRRDKRAEECRVARELSTSSGLPLRATKVWLRKRRTQD